MYRIPCLFLCVTLSATTAWGDSIARDSVLAGSPAVPATGEYIQNMDSQGQNPTIAGFVDAWLGNTGTIEVSGAGLDYPDMGALGLKHRFTHNVSLVNYPRSVKRVIDPTYDLAAPAYYSDDAPSHVRPVLTIDYTIPGEDPGVAGDPADPSGDGLVGSADLDIVRGNWGAGTPPSAVPEPGTLVLLIVGIAGLGLFGRRR